jgi:predicted DCC family thiol-disulfide oxidoreductase YuxK
MNAPPSAPPPAGWILYDDSCGICRRAVPLWAGALRRRGFALAPLQAGWVAGRLGLPPEEVVQDLRLLLADGRHFAGAEAYRQAWRRIGWARPLYLLAAAPGLRGLFDRAYRAFARRRHRLSAACGWTPPPPQEQ